MNSLGLLFITVFVVICCACKKEAVNLIPTPEKQIIADHTVVDRFDNIPEEYIAEVKKMLLLYPGESHSTAIMDGLTMLESSYPKFAVNVTASGSPESNTTSYLRASRATWGDLANSSGWIYSYGEEDWWTSVAAITRTKDGINYCNTHNLTINAMGYGWCSEMGCCPSYWPQCTSSYPDPEYGCHWHGASVGGPEGDSETGRCWGIDDNDNANTGNSLNLTNGYLRATQQYIDYCSAMGYKTKVFFTTGPVDWDGWYTAGAENGYSASLKQQAIRDYVATDSTRILFDYADILCYDDNGSATTSLWNGHSFPCITAANRGNGDYGHIGPVGAIRLAKAMWWMLARMAGWDGN